MTDSKAKLQLRIKVARGEEPGDLVLKNGQVVNVFTGEIIPADVAIVDGVIAGVDQGYSGHTEIDATDRWVVPGFIEGHIHLESSLLTPEQFTNVVLPCGTTSVICDPHEIANVLGVAGIEWLLKATEDLPISFYFMLPSCVPSCHLETSGAILNRLTLAGLAKHDRVLGLAEMMNFPGVVNGMEDVLAKLAMAHANGMLIDGHAPGLSGRDLQAYVTAKIKTDHEVTSVDEALEKLRLGMYLLIREGSTAKNLRTLLPVVQPETARRCLFVSDDRHPDDLVNKGHLDYTVRLAISQGMPPVTAIQLATLNVAECFGLSGRGAIAPGYRADCLVLDNLEEVRINEVISNGRLVASAGKPTPAIANSRHYSCTSSMHIDWHQVNFAIPVAGEMIRVIGVVENQLLTTNKQMAPKTENGLVVSDLQHDLLKLAVIERHTASGRVGLGMVQGFGLQRGALSGTVAHDAHNLLVVGVNDKDMLLAAETVADMDGGLAVVADGKVLASLALPLAGLMSDQPVALVQQQMADVIKAAHKLGCGLANPFMALSFLSLPVIPELKLTDLGLVDVNIFDLVPLWVHPD